MDRLRVRAAITDEGDSLLALATVPNDIAAALAVVWVALPAETQAAVLDLLGIDARHLPGLVGVAVILGRLIAQPKVLE